MMVLRMLAVLSVTLAGSGMRPMLGMFHGGLRYGKAGAPGGAPSFNQWCSVCHFFKSRMSFSLAAMISRAFF